MNYVKVSVSDDLPIPLDVLKQRLQVEDTGDETFDAAQDETLRAACLAAVDYAEAQTHLVLRPTVFRLDLSNWCTADPYGGPARWWACCRALSLDRVPVKAVETISYLGRGEITYDDLPDVDWTLQALPAGALIHLTDGVSLPSLENRFNAVQITFTAGFEIPGATGSGDDPALALPYGLQQALTLLTGHWFTNRDAVGTERMYEVEMAAAALMQAFRLYR